jgi:hypothetical protein
MTGCLLSVSSQSQKLKMFVKDVSLGGQKRIEPSGSIKCGEFLSSIGCVNFSGRTLLCVVGCSSYPHIACEAPVCNKLEHHVQSVHQTHRVHIF